MHRWICCVWLMVACASAPSGMAPSDVVPEPVQEDVRVVDPTDPEAVARAVLLAYQARDLDRLEALAEPSQRPIFAAMRDQSPSARKLFQGWRWVAVSGWDPAGSLEVRYVSHVMARVRFGASRGEVFVVTLVGGQARWFLEDIHSPSVESFAAYAKVRPSPEAP
ncbi:MAG: hypothetical protein AAFS10_11770 [Myxococcota bacterium]